MAHGHLLSPLRVGPLELVAVGRSALADPAWTREVTQGTPD